MMCSHHQLVFEVDDDWLAKAGLLDFEARDASIVADYAKVQEQEVFTVEIASVEPALELAALRGVFCDYRATGESARDRAVRILRWLRERRPIESVRVIPFKSEDFEFRLVRGRHRFYCAVALGFSEVPATMGLGLDA